MNPYTQFLLALAMWREASDQGTEGLQAVGCVIRNKVGVIHAHIDRAWLQVILYPYYISSMTALADRGTIRWPMLEDVTWSSAQLLAQGILTGAIKDNTSGATQYLNKEETLKLRGKLPIWTSTMKEVAVIGGHTFYATFNT